MRTVIEVVTEHSDLALVGPSILRIVRTVFERI